MTRLGRMIQGWTLAAFVAIALHGGAVPMLRAQSQSPSPDVTSEIGIDQKLDSQLPLGLEFKDEAGRAVHLGDYFGTKPVVLVMAYYGCPMLCTTVLNGVVKGLRPLKIDIGKEFNVLTVSINPSETPGLASEKKATYIKSYNRPGAAEGWHFLTGEKGAIDSLAAATGFRYVYDQNSGQYAHAAGIMVLTPGGKISRYFYGVEYAAEDLRLGLVKASDGEIGTMVDEVKLLCFDYDPMTGKYKYSALAVNLVRGAGILTLLGLGYFFYRTMRRSRITRAAVKGAESGVA
ncbi:MAG: SCO family protein [Candidatus Kapaibacterium sp.]